VVVVDNADETTTDGTAGAVVAVMNLTDRDEFDIALFCH